MEFWTVFTLLLATATAASYDVPLRKPIHMKMERPVLYPGIPPTGGRITGGDPAAVGQFPYQAGLFITVGSQLYFCGGVLVTKKDVITAAHCCEGASQIQVILGSIEIYNTSEPGRITRTVTSANIKINSGWNSTNLANDICMLRIAEVTLTSNIGLATLPPDDSQTYTGDLVIASGWGRDSDSSPSISPILRFVKVNVITNTACNVYGIIQPTNICIGTTGGKSTCNGDSGGPLVLDPTVSPNRVLVGITSFGAAAGCELGYPAAFTRVSKYLVWIQDNINAP